MRLRAVYTDEFHFFNDQRDPAGFRVEVNPTYEQHPRALLRAAAVRGHTSHFLAADANITQLDHGVFVFDAQSTSACDLRKSR